MKKIFSDIKTLAALLIAGAAFTACSSDDNITGEQPAQGTKTYTMTVNASKGGDATTRALSLEGKTLNATWATTENVYVKKGDTWATGSLQPEADGATATLKGELTGITPASSDVLTLQFPRSGERDYSGQVGTLADIAAKYDYATATVTVADVSATGNIIPEEATTTFTNQQAIVKFTLIDKADGTTSLNASQLVINDGTTDYTITPASATSEIYAAIPGFTGQTVTLTATVGSDTYTYEKSGVSFTNGKYYEITVKMSAPAPAYTLLSAATTADYGKVVCADGHLHDAKTAVPAGCTAVGILGKVTETGHGLILALKNATSQNWNTINGWTSETTFAGTTLKVLPDDAARGTNLTSYTTLGETTVSNWAVAQKDDYVAIFTNLGSTTSNTKGTTYDGNVNAYITTNVGGTAMSNYYWSATEKSGSYAWYFGSGSGAWNDGGKSGGRNVRPVLGFGGEATPAAAEGHALSASVVGELVGSDGLAYAAADKDNLPTGVTAAGMVAYKDGSNGLVIALADEASTMDWSTACGASGAAAHTPIVTGQTWKLPSWEDWQHIRNAYGYQGTALNTAIENVGGTAIPTARFNPETESMTNIYWSSTEFAANTTQAHVSGINGGGEIFAGEGDHDLKETSKSVRACLAF